MNNPDYISILEKAHKADSTAKLNYGVILLAFGFAVTSVILWRHLLNSNIKVRDLLEIQEQNELENISLKESNFEKAKRIEFQDTRINKLESENLLNRPEKG